MCDDDTPDTCICTQIYASATHVLQDILYSASLHTSTMPHPCAMHPYSPHAHARKHSTADTSSEAPALETSSSSVRKESGAYSAKQH